MQTVRWLVWTLGLAATAAFPVLIFWLVSTTPPVAYDLADLAWILLLVLPAVLVAWSTFPASRSGSISRRLLFVTGLFLWGVQASGPEAAQGLLYLVSGGAGIVLMLVGSLLPKTPTSGSR